MPNNEPKRARVIRPSQSTQSHDPALSSSANQHNSDQPFRRPSQIYSGFENLNFQNGNRTRGELGNEAPISRSRRSSVMGQPPVGKMLLPPLQGSHVARSANKTLEKSRTSHACDKCRRAKAKCSGGNPCEKCKNEGKQCVYGAGKRDREKLEMARVSKRYKHANDRNTQLVALLQRLGECGQLSHDKVQEIHNVLANSPKPLSDDEDGGVYSPQKGNLRRSYSDSSGERDADGDVGSTGSLDTTYIDMNQNDDTRAEGFLGKSSSVSWLRRAKNETGSENGNELHPDIIEGMASERPLAMSNYMTNSADQGGIEDIPVNPYELPPHDVAHALVKSYFESVHPACPLFLKCDFMEAFNSFPRDQDVNLSLQDKTWLCIINLVFAIGARLAHLTNASYQGDERDDILYFARARRLGMDDEHLLYKDAELRRTCCLGLLVIYLMSSNQLNKAWVVNGLAVRHAISLGLHMRNEATTLTDVDKEIQIRVWWSLYSLERQLNALTGRPSSISNQDVSTPLPINMDEELFNRAAPFNQSLRPGAPSSPSGEPNLTLPRGDNRHEMTQQKTSPVIGKAKSSTSTSSPSSRRASIARSSLSTTPFAAISAPVAKLTYTTSTFFIYSIQLSIVYHDILQRLYSSATINQKWSDIQNIIQRMEQRLQTWKSSLPAELDFTREANDQYDSQRRGLEMFYNSARMTLFRPCLCRFDGRIPHESQKSKTFNHDAVRGCVDSARAVITAFTDKPDPTEIYKISGWWNALHYLCEAASILMLEIAYRAQHMPSEVDDIFDDAKNAVRWLRTLSETSISARKGWEIFDGLLRDVAPRIGHSTDGMETEAPIPPNWRHKSRVKNPGNTSGNNSSVTTYQSLPITTSAYNDPSQFSGMQQHDTTADWVQHGQFSNSQQVPPTSYTPISTHYLQSIPLVSMAGTHYGRYDEFGPWQGSYTQGNYYPSSSAADNFQFPSTAATMSVNDPDILTTARGIDNAVTPLALTSEVPGRSTQVNFASQNDWFMSMGMFPGQGQGNGHGHYHDHGEGRGAF